MANSGMVRDLAGTLAVRRAQMVVLILMDEPTAGMKEPPATRAPTDTR